MNSELTRQRLYQCGFTLICQNGVSQFSVRKLADLSQCNLGTFVYHFGKKDEFIKLVISNWYQPLLNQCHDIDKQEIPSIHKLQLVLNVLITFIQHNLVSFVNFYHDILSNHAEIFEVIAQSHLKQLLLKLIKAAQFEGDVVNDDPCFLLVFLLSPFRLPDIVTSLLQHDSFSLNEVSPKYWQQIKRAIPWVLNGIKTSPVH